MFFFLFFLSYQSNDSIIDGFITSDFKNMSSVYSSINISIVSESKKIISKVAVSSNGYWILLSPDRENTLLHVEGPKGICFDKNSISLKKGQAKEIKIKLIGFTIEGQITFKTKVNKLNSCIPIEIKSKKKTKIVYSNANGTFKLSPVEPGRYTISTKHGICEAKEVMIKHESVFIKSLLIKKYPIKGKVVFPEEKYERSIELTVKKQKIGFLVTTDSHGNFILDGLKPGSYIIESNEEDVFVSKTSFVVSYENEFKEVNVKFAGIKVTGHVEAEYCQADEIIVSLNGKNATTDKKGYFAIENVLPTDHPKIEAHYRYSKFRYPKIPSIGTRPIPPITIMLEDTFIDIFVDCNEADIEVGGGIRKSFHVTDKNLSFAAPINKVVMINITSKCIFDTNVISALPPAKIGFYKKRGNLAGSIECTGECNEAELNMFNGESQYSIPIAKNGTFSITDIDYGEYDYEIKSKDDTEWNYINASIVIDKNNTEYYNLASDPNMNFVEAPREMTVLSEGELIDLHEGENVFRYKDSVIYPADCYIFDPFTLRERNRVIIQGIERIVTVTGEVERSGFEVLVDRKKIQKPYHFIQKMNKTSTVEVIAQKPFIVEPKFYEISSAERCESCNLTFNIKSGVTIRGRITPALANVTINAFSKNKIIGTNRTNYQGIFYLGDYPTDQRVILIASKEGYIFKQVPKTFNFVAERLATIKVIIESEETNETIVSITKSDGYREIKNYNSSFIEFPALLSGNYCVKPTKREYSFIPSFADVVITRGIDKTIHFSMRKTKFGVSGVVVFSDKKPIANTEVRAIANNGDFISTTTNEKGEFRIGNLLANSSYDIHVNKINVYEKIVPERKSIFLREEELKGLVFMSVPVPTSFDVYGTLNIENKDLLDNMCVMIKSFDNQTVGKSCMQSKESNMFFFFNLTNRFYTIEASCSQQASETVTCNKVTVAKPRSLLANAEIKCHVEEHKEVLSAAELKRKSRTAKKWACLSLIAWICFFNAKTFISLVKGEY